MQLSCENTEEGIASLRKLYQSLVDGGAELKESNEWLESEDEILAKMPLLQREQIKVSESRPAIRCLRLFSRADNVGPSHTRGGRPSSATTAAGWPPARQSTPSARCCGSAA